MAGRDGGQVDVRFSVANAEVVRNALSMLGRDGEKALKQLDAAAKPIPKTTGLISSALAETQSKAQEFGARLGPVGAGLAALGPAGLVAAGALGVVALAVSHMRDEAIRLSNDAGRMVDFAETVKLSVEQIQALRFAGSQAGVSNEKMETSITRLTVSMNQLRDGTGDAYNEIRKIDPALARQLSQTRDTAAAIDLIAQAWSRADTAQRNALSRAAFGRGGVDFGRVLDQVNSAGGLENFASSQRQSIVLTTEQARKFDELSDRITSTRQRARDLMASLWTDDVLKRELRHVEYMERAARAAKEMADNPSWWRRLVDGFLNNDPRQRAQGTGLGRGGGGLRLAPADPKIPNVLGEFGQLPEAPPAQEPPTARFRLNEFREYIALLGAAVTPADQLKMKELEIEAALEGVNKQSADYAKLQAAAQRGQRAHADALQQAAVSARARLGIADEEELMLARRVDLDKAYRDGFIRNAEEYARAEGLIRKEIKDTMQAMEVRASRFPGLTRFQQEARDLDKQMDQLAVGGVNNFSTALTDIATGTRTTGDAFRNLATQVTRSVLEMVIRMQIAIPIAKALQSAMGSFMPGGLTAFGGGGAGDQGPLQSAMGNVFGSGGVMAFARGGVVDTPSFFPMAGGRLGSIAESGDERAMPLRRKDETV